MEKKLLLNFVCMSVLFDTIFDSCKLFQKTLFSAMEYVVSLMRQVEDKERAAEQAKVEVASGGMDILNKVEELKQMLEYAKKGNNMVVILTLRINDSLEILTEKCICRLTFVFFLSGCWGHLWREGHPRD